MDLLFVILVMFGIVAVAVAILGYVLFTRQGEDLPGPAWLNDFVQQRFGR